MLLILLFKNIMIIITINLLLVIYLILPKLLLNLRHLSIVVFKLKRIKYFFTHCSFYYRFFGFLYLNIIFIIKLTYTVYLIFILYKWICYITIISFIRLYILGQYSFILILILCVYCKIILILIIFN